MTEDNDANIHELDRAFTLPDVIEDVELRELYEVLVARMRREAEHLPMNTVQQLLIERIAFNYIAMRWYEARRLFAHTTAQKEFNTFWLSMTREFNAQLRAQDDEARNALIKQIVGIITDVLTPEDPAIRERLRDRFSDAFKEYGI
jgi:hypothetical protein